MWLFDCGYAGECPWSQEIYTKVFDIFNWLHTYIHGERKCDQANVANDKINDSKERVYRLAMYYICDYSKNWTAFKLKIWEKKIVRDS